MQTKTNTLPKAETRCTEIFSDTLRGFAGIEEVDYDYKTGSLKAVYDPRLLSNERALQVVNQAGREASMRVAQCAAKRERGEEACAQCAGHLATQLVSQYEAAAMLPSAKFANNALEIRLNQPRLAAAEHSSLPVHVIDSGQLSFGLGLQVLETAKAAAAGASLEELLALLDSLAARTFAFASLSTLEYLRRGGRISNLGTQIASLLDIKPIMKMNRGKAGMEVARTRRRALERVISLTASLGRLEAIGFTHANAADEVAALRERLARVTTGLPEAVVTHTTPALGAHVGPGTVCAVCLAAEAPSGPGPNTVERIRQTFKTLTG